MSSKRKGGFFVTLLVILLVAGVFLGLGAGLYVSGLMPSFNVAVDTYLQKESAVAVTATEPVTVVESLPGLEPVDVAPVTVTEPEQEVVPEEPAVTVSLIEQYLAPAETTAHLIFSGFRTWAGNSVTDLPELSFFYPRNSDGTWSVPVEDYENRLIPFIPEEQGMYTIGLAEDRGTWISALAFVSVFESTGEQLAVSVDYHADRPQVTLHLRDDRIYYIAQGFFTDEEPVPEHTVLRVQEAL